MNVQITNENGICLVKPNGWLSTQNAGEFASATDTLSGYSEMIIDLDDVEYMASSGLRQIVALYKKAQELGASFKVINVYVSVMEIFKLTGIDKKIAIEAK